MIAPLRRWHRRAFLSLAAGLPILVVAAIAARPAPAVLESLPTTVRKRSSVPLELLDPDPEGDATAELEPGGRRLRVRLDATPADGLFYWVAGDVEVEEGGALPDRARLLAAPVREGSHAIALPSDLEVASGGRLVLFSLAHERVAGVLEVAAP